MTLRTFLDLIGKDENYKVVYCGNVLLQDLSGNQNIELVTDEGNIALTYDSDKPNLEMYREIMSRNVKRIRIIDIEIGKPYYEITLNTY